MLDILFIVIIVEVCILIGVEEFEKQHLESYKNAILELIKNNTETLVYDDITSLLKCPPLDSMDMVRGKLVNLSKKYGVILDTEMLNKILAHYRSTLVESFSNIGNDRIVKLSKLVESFCPKRENDIIKLPKKEFALINKNLKKEAKEKVKSSNQVLIDGFSTLFKEDANVDDTTKVMDTMKKYLSSSYSKDLIESMELKIIIKDTTLINSVLEQGERYLFTKNNSHLFDEKVTEGSK